MHTFDYIPAHDIGLPKGSPFFFIAGFNIRLVLFLKDKKE